MSSIVEFEEIVDIYFNEYLKLSNVIGGHVAEQAEIVNQAIDAERSILKLAMKCSKPTDSQVQTLVKPLASKIEQVQQLREKNRNSSFFNHLSTISESVPALGWIVVSPTPAPYVKEMSDSGKFFGNKVLVAYKGKDNNHVNWVNAWNEFLENLQKYIRKIHTTGLAWNPRGCNPIECMSQAPTSGSMPPPPPPPPPMSLNTSTPIGGDVNELRTALMNDLNVGTGITGRLRTVAANQQTHKNPELRNQPGLTPAAKISPQPPTRTLKDITHPPKLCLEGRKWLVEYQIDQKDLIIQVNEMSESIHLYKCKNTLLVIKGKANSLILDSCVKTSVVFDDIVSSVEFVNCQDVKAQSMGKVPTISVEKTDVATIYLSNESLNAEIVTAKSSSVNINVPDEENGFVEHAIPEQFKSIWKGKGFHTEPTDIAS